MHCYIYVTNLASVVVFFYTSSTVCGVLDLNLDVAYANEPIALTYFNAAGALHKYPFCTHKRTVARVFRFVVHRRGTFSLNRKSFRLLINILRYPVDGLTSV